MDIFTCLIVLLSCVKTVFSEEHHQDSPCHPDNGPNCKGDEYCVLLEHGDGIVCLCNTDDPKAECSKDNECPGGDDSICGTENRCKKDSSSGHIYCVPFSYEAEGKRRRGLGSNGAVMLLFAAGFLVVGFLFYKKKCKSKGKFL